ncbi:hemicentin-2-like [Uranotaenia lowii]|uniref:hemicentin-2-like n=1 Tax=Uranotaenia lowii TaxID=190385 RepID=UPI0024789723|nr:hemicentin-2-like [Uranotaenia lowii]
MSDITSCGIQQNRPIDGGGGGGGSGSGRKSLSSPLGSFEALGGVGSSRHMRAYVAAASTSSGGPGHQQQQLQSATSGAGGSGSGLVVPQSTGVGIGSVGKWDEPYFDDTTPRNVTALVGKSAYLSCRVKNLGNKTVSWIRHRDIHILTVGSYTYTSDQRFQATHHKNTDDWTLQIKWAQKRDAGIYECQISTQPVRSYFVTLSVVVPTATIIGGPDLHVDKGSTINLTCAVKYSPEPPAYIFWYHHDEVISYDSSRGGVSVITEKGDITTSHLLIQNADLDDSGKYSCSPSNADVASVRVHVLNGEHPEAMQTGAATRVTSPSERRRHFVVILLVTALLTFYRWLTMGGSSQALAASALLKVSPASSSGRGLSTATSTDHHFSRWWPASAKTSSTIRGRQRPASEAAGHPDQRFQNHGNGNGGQLRECCPTNLRWSSR